MSIFASPRFLRQGLAADAASGAVTSLVHLLGAGALAPLLGLPQGLIVASGLALVLFVAGAAYLATCEPVPRSGVRLIVACNWAWVGGCLVLLATGAATTSLGHAYLVVQAVVGLLVEGLRLDVPHVTVPRAHATTLCWCPCCCPRRSPTASPTVPSRSRSGAGAGRT